LDLSGSRCTEPFRELLRGFDVAQIESQSDVVYGLTADFRLAYFNSSWFAFAEANDGEPAISTQWGLGRLVIDALPSPLRKFYRELYAAALAHKPATHPLHHQYVCPSPTTHRDFAMTLYPLQGGQGILVVNSLREEHLVEGPTVESADRENSPYRTPQGTVTQCCHCRKIQNQRSPKRWDWISAWVKQSPPNTSHGLCNLCLDYYYPEEG